MTDSDYYNYKNVQIKTFKYRWLIIGLYVLNTCSSMFQNGQYTIIANKIQEYYDVSNFIITLTKMVTWATLVIFIIPAVYITEKYNLRHAHLIASGLTFLGNLLKLLSLSPDRFYIVIIAQVLCGIARVFIIALPSKIVAVWCSAEEQNRACGVAVWGGMIGSALGSILPVVLIQDLETTDEIGKGLFTMLLGNAVFSGIVFVAVVIFFKAKPALPPSVQQVDVQNMKTNFMEGLKQLYTNKEFLKLMGLFGGISVLNESFGGLQNEIYEESFPDYMNDLATVHFTLVITAGIIGNFSIGYLLDKTLQYKWISVGLLISIALSYAPMAVFFEMKLHICGFISFIVWEFCVGLTVNISYQYIAEVTYPVSELVTLSTLLTLINLITIITQIFFVMLIDAKSFLIFHIIMFSSLSVIALCSFSLSPRLKRMLVKVTE